MKAFFSLLIILPLFINAQKIEGFGQLKIGKTLNQIINDLAIDTKTIIDESKGDKLKFYDLYMPKKTVLLKFDTLRKEKYEFDYYYSKNPKVTKLILPNYKVSDIAITDITLSFYNDTLYMINVKNPTKDFKSAFEAKYGSGDVKQESKTVKCSSAFQSSFEVEEKTFTTSWPSNDSSIVVISVLSSYRDSKCQEQFLTYFLVQNKITNKLVEFEAKEFTNRISLKKDQELKSKLKDF